MLEIAPDWKEYKLLDTGNFEKLEMWGDFILARPEPQAIWDKANSSQWGKADAYFSRNKDGGGEWRYKNNIPSEWTIDYEFCKFIVKPTSFKHTGIFPEQSTNWHWIKNLKRGDQTFKILNLFAYTGCSTTFLALNNYHVTHVDSSSGMTNIAKKNCRLSGVKTENTRFIIDDVNKFVNREINRKSTYDGVILDPPSYGRGSKGELWQLEKSLAILLKKINLLLSDKPLFLVLNTYATDLSPYSINELCKKIFGKAFSSNEVLELGIKSLKNAVLPAGRTCRLWN